VRRGKRIKKGSERVVKVGATVMEVDFIEALVKGRNLRKVCMAKPEVK